MPASTWRCIPLLLLAATACAAEETSPVRARPEAERAAAGQVDRGDSGAQEAPPGPVPRNACQARLRLEAREPVDEDEPVPPGRNAHEPAEIHEVTVLAAEPVPGRENFCVVGTRLRAFAAPSPMPVGEEYDARLELTGDTERSWWIETPSDGPAPGPAA